MHLINGKRYLKAAREGNVKVLMEANRWEVNMADENGMSPLLWAAHEGHTEAVRILLKRKSKISKVDNFGNSALHLAAARGHLECVQLVISKGANLYGLDGGQRTASDLARIGEWDDVVELLELRMKVIEERNPKLVLKLQALASKQFLEIKEKKSETGNNIVLKSDERFQDEEKIHQDEFRSVTNSPEDNPTEEELYQHNSSILGLLQHKTGGITSSTSKSAARSYLVFSELVKEQSINQTIVNRLEARPQRKSIKQVHPTADDGDTDDSEEDPTADSSESSLLSFLKIYDLQRYHQQLVDKEIDLNGLKLMTEHDIKALGLPLGPHRKLCVALEEYKSAQKWDQA
ncbi:ankyrin repeat and SAM domain-containing protein 4B-like [Ochlerotatus camptorhynchus]|uniref:ankyrin repeat and SAM domain-containing protein 4B-like n=1 Tax=Ochlerotatus camptorhynchus TaxID=644619 RepID=UPI0031D5B636